MIGGLLVAATLACASLPTTTPTPAPRPSPTAVLATPSSLEPAAGICGEAAGGVVTIALHPDVPDPRCAIVHPDQILEIINDADAARQVSLGPFLLDVPAGSGVLLDQPFGTYLAPGVHRVQADPCCGAELWLKSP
jgi:hypothetical protein